MPDFHGLRVLETREEIGGKAKTIVFEVPSALQTAFNWRPGQHVTLRFQFETEERRSYSLSSSPFSDDGMRITVKRVDGGLVSNHINDKVAAGDHVDVMPPFGGFCLDPGERLRRTHYFFAAGSGITPIFAMLHSVMIAEPYSVAHLAYGNSDARTIIFKDQLQALQETYDGRVTVSHVLSNASFWSGFRPWRQGIIDNLAVEAVIAENPPYAQDTQYYVCGPGTMNGDVRRSLMSLDVPPDRIHSESYGSATEPDLSVTGIAARAILTLDSERHTIEIAADQTILEAARDAGLSPPYSCQSGVCGACRAKLEQGAVHMRSCMALEQTDIDAGQILTCQSVATTTDLSIDYS